MKAVIKISNLEKKYFLFEKDYKVIPWLFTKKGNYAEKVPLTNINLTINEGDVIGFIGKNGAGKSTLMKIIAGITEQTNGTIEVNGTVNSLINLGAGFHPKYTGRQNIYYKGLLMGMAEKKIDEIIDEIIDFCELGDYFDLPIYMYSSGMSARLGFALAIFAEHDILIVDEIFAVGDKMFREKSVKKMKELFKSGKSIIFASHSDEYIKEFCNRAIFIDDSKIVLDGTVEEVLEAYNKKYDLTKVRGKSIKYTHLDNFENYLHQNISIEKADLYREIALFFELENEMNLAYKCMSYAKYLRPEGPYIRAKFTEYDKQIKDKQIIRNFNSQDNINRFLKIVNIERQNIDKALLYREIAIYCELEGDLEKANKYMDIAKEIRPNV